MPNEELDRLDQLAEDPAQQAYIDSATKQLVFKNRTEDAATLAQRQARGLKPATPQDVDVRREYLRHTSTGAQVEAAAKLGANVATFGLAGFDSEEDKALISDFKDASPTLSTLTEVAGAALPGVAGGAVGGAVMSGLGLSGRAATIGTLISEEVAQSTAIAAEHALEEGRGIELGEVLMGVPLALGMSAAGRLAAGGARRVRQAFGRGAEDVLEASAAEGNALARGRRTSEARRSVGAAGAKGEGDQILTEAEVRARARDRTEIHSQVEQMGGDAIDSTVGGTEPAMDLVHNIRLKKGDVAGRMGEADLEAVGDFSVMHAGPEGSVQKLADELDGMGAKSTARQIRADLETVRAAEDVEDIALGFDQVKRTLDHVRNRYGAVKDSTAKEIAHAAQQVSDQLRKGLEDEGTWGKFWAEKQSVENELWSGSARGKKGIIHHGSIWQHEFLERSPGASGRVWRGDDTVPVLRLRKDIVQAALDMTPRRFKEVTEAWDSWIEDVGKMSQLKTDLGVKSVETSPVMRLQEGLNMMRETIEELKLARQVEHRGADEIKKQARREATRAGAEVVFEVAQEMPVIGPILKGANRAAGKQGQSLSDRLFQSEVKPPRREYSAGEARKALGERRSLLGKPAARARADVPAGVEGPPTGDLAAALGTLGKGASRAARGAAAVERSTNPVTDTLAEISDHSRAIRERAALGLVSKPSRAPKLPPLATRFKEQAPDLQTAFMNRAEDLRRVNDDPQAFVYGMADTFGDIADEHEDLYTRLVARVQIGAQYLIANMPPSVGISMVRPDGIPPDSLAIMQWAAMYDAVFNPGNVVYDVGTGDATPTQIKALREVHPDIYGALRADVLKQVGQAGQSIPFETLRTLDVLFDLPGAAGLAFGDGMQATMSSAYAQKGSQSPRQSLGGESVIAPSLATKSLLTGPSTLQS